MSALLSLAFAVAAQSGTPAIKVPYEKVTLKNGMKVILHVDKTLPVATINTWFYVGSKDEPERRSGFAHLFEHLMFMGTKRVPNSQFDFIMEQAGGQNNASTSEDRTNYYSFGPSNLLPKLLWLDADRLEGLSKDMTQAKLDLQRDVVKNERRQNVENQPYGKAYEAINALMFPKGHPYSTSVIGSHEDLSAAAVSDVVNFFDTFYVPNNATLVVAGDFDKKKIMPLVNDLFGTLPRANDVSRKLVQPFTFKKTNINLVDQVSAKKSLLVWHTPAIGQPGFNEARMAASVLGDGLASRLQKEVVNKRGLASEIGAFHSDQYLGSLFYIDATVADGKSQADMDLAILKVVSEFAAKGPTQDELSRFVAKFEAQTARTLQSIDQKADRMNYYEFYYGNPDYFQKEIDSFKSVTPAAVAATAKKYLTENRLTLHVLPESEPAEQNPRDTEPGIESSATFTTPKPTVGTLKNGISLSSWSRAGVPVLDATVFYPIGTMSDAKPGAIYMAAELMLRGAKKLNSEAFSAQLDGLGASIYGGAGKQSTTFSVEVPISNAAKALDMLAGVVSAPTLAKGDFEQLKDEIIAQLQQENDNAGSVARKVALREFLGASHPYAKADSGTLKQAEAITFEDVKKAATQIMAVKPKVFVASGTSIAASKALLDTAFTGAKLGSGAAPNYSVPALPSSDLRVVVVDRPKAVQSVINILFPAINNSTNEFRDLDAVRVVSGGSFTSRLNQNLREKKGYTYGAGSRLGNDPNIGWFTMQSSVRADVTGASLQEFLNEIARLETGDIEAKEAGKAAEIMRTDMVTNYSTLADLVASGVAAETTKITPAKADEILAYLKTLSSDKLNAASRKFLQKGQALIVIVGDKVEVLKQIEGLGLPAAKVVTAD